MMASELGFEGLLWNSMGAVTDRGFVAETLQWGSMLMMHVSRWAEDLIKNLDSLGLPRVRADNGLHDDAKGSSEHVQRESWENMLDSAKTVSDSVQIATGVPFRETHHISGRVLKPIGARFERDIAEYFDYDRSVEMRSAQGGMRKECVLEQIKVLRESLNN
ncbi:hypothetical protein EKO27_g1728 [Xylaria grammica]|uniref:Uncharacterized protein n=1 Tax=Xylaria grammica TaxID=363999 RepID=A0A439DG64_9PEZI|nr:hypothetical protein EKO27_g1728 [Xylaria grammica]